MAQIVTLEDLDAMSPEQLAKREYDLAALCRRDSWVPASGGTETPFKARSGATLLYCFNHALGRHAYVDLGSDLVLSDDEALAHLGTH